MYDHEHFQQFYRVKIKPGLSGLATRRAALLPLAYFTRAINLIILLIVAAVFDAFPTMDFFNEGFGANVVLVIHIVLILVFGLAAWFSIRSEIKRVWRVVYPDVFNTGVKISLFSLLLAAALMALARGLSMWVFPRDLDIMYFVFTFFGVCAGLVVLSLIRSSLEKGERQYNRNVHNRLRDLVLKERESNLAYHDRSRVSRSAFESSLIFNNSEISRYAGRGLLVSPEEDPDYLLGFLDVVNVSTSGSGSNRETNTYTIFSGTFTRLASTNIPIGQVVVASGARAHKWVRRSWAHPDLEHFSEARNEDGHGYPGLEVLESEPGLSHKVLDTGILKALQALDEVTSSASFFISFIDNAVYLGISLPELWGPEILLPPSHMGQVEKAYRLWNWLLHWPTVVNPQT